MIDGSVTAPKQRPSRAGKPKKGSKTRPVKTQEQRQAEAAEKAARAAAREAVRAQREEAAAKARAEQNRIAYQARLEHEKKRAGQRLLQEAGIAWLMGYDTPAARMFGNYVRDTENALRETERRRAAAGDPLNLTGHTPKPSEKEERRRAEKERLARGERKLTIPDPDNPRQNVLVSSTPYSIRRVKLKTNQVAGADSFLRDWESANYAGLNSLGFEPRVDSSPKPSQEHRSSEAARRLKMAKAYMGERNFEICYGVLILNLNPSKIHAAGGRQHRIVANDIEVALNSLSGFYDPERIQRDPTWRAFKKMINAALDLISEGEEEVR